MTSESRIPKSTANSVVAGYAAGVCGVVVGHPMDSAKVWLQTEAPPTATALPSGRPAGIRVARLAANHASPSSVQRAMSTIASPVSPTKRRSNLRALYSGVTAPLFTVGLVQSVSFGVYDSARRCLHQLESPQAASHDYLTNSSLRTVAIASTASGAVMALVTNPLIIIKTKQQIMAWSFRQAYIETLRSPVPGQGFRLTGFYAGFGPHVLMESVGRGVYFCAYECLKKQLQASKQTTTTSIQDRMLCAASAGIVSCCVMFPLDAVRSKLIANSLSGETTQALTLLRNIYRREGSLRSLYRGFGITVLRSGPVAAAVLPVYDLTLEWLNSH